MTMSHRNTVTGRPHRSCASRSSTSPAHLLLPYPMASSSSTVRVGLMTRMSASSVKSAGSICAPTVAVDTNANRLRVVVSARRINSAVPATFGPNSSL